MSINNASPSRSCNDTHSHSTSAKSATTDKNVSSGGSSADVSTLKYGDADVCSKRRKAGLQAEGMLQESTTTTTTTMTTTTTPNDDDSDYRSFEGIAAECCMNSSFQSCPSSELDFKGGLVVADTTDSTLQSSFDEPDGDQSPNRNRNRNQNQSAKHNLTITTKPSLTSKGFENTFKLLQSHVEQNSQKSQCLMQILRSDSSSLSGAATSTTVPSSGALSAVSPPSSDEELPSRLELELEAMQRMQTLVTDGKVKGECENVECKHCDTIPRPLLSLLYEFVSKNKVHEKGDASQPTGSDGATAKSDFMYHAYKGMDGRNCIRIVRSLLTNKVLCGNRVSQMTRAYDDIEAVTRLLEEKEKDLELTVQIGKELLTQNNALENRINELEADLKSSNDDRAQLIHELHKKNELIAVLTNDGDDTSETDTPTLSKSITLDLMQKKIASLQDENKSLKMEASHLALKTDEVEAHERQLMEDISSQMYEANSQFDNLSLEMERQREENRLQHEQIVSLTARLAEAEMRLHQLTHDNDEHLSLLNITKENQNSLALELVEFKQRYQEVLALLQEAQEQLRKQRKKQMPQARSSFMSGMGHLQPESLQSELMESSLYSENSLDSGISGDSQRVNDRIGRLMAQLPTAGAYSGGAAYAMSGSGYGVGIGNGVVPPYKRVFETVRCASKNGNYVDSGNASMTQLGAMSMSSSSVLRMSAMAGASGATSHPAGSFYRHSGGYYDGHHPMGLRTLSCESLASQSDDGYPTQPSGVPGAPGAKDLEAALKRLTPAEVLARRAMLSYAPAGTYNYDDQPQPSHQLPMGIRTPDSIMSTGSSGISASSVNMSASMNPWRLPEKLQIVKPIEGSQTLHHWSRLATPTLSGLLDDRPGVTIRGGRGLDDLGLQVYTLSDVEEDMVADDQPGKQFEAPGYTYTMTTSMVLHPDDGLITDLSFLSQSQVSSRMASTSTSRQPSCPPTPRGGLSRKNSCSTFSVDMGLASMLNERGIKAVTPSALNTPAGPNFSPTTTPCNSPEGSPTRSMSPEPLFGILSTGADLIRRKLIGGDIERPIRNQKQQKQQKIMLSRLERRALRSLKLMEKVESLGLENIIATQPNSMSQLASGIANRSSSPMGQLTSLKTMHTDGNSSSSSMDGLHFDRQQIKDILHKGLTSPSAHKQPYINIMETNSGSCSTSAYSSDQDDCASASAARQDCDRGATAGAAALRLINETSTPTKASNSTSSIVAATTNATDTRIKQMQRQKSRRNLKNGIAQQRPDLGTIGGGRVRPDLGRVRSEATAAAKERNSASDKAASAAMATTTTTTTTTPPPSREAGQQQSITQSFVGTVSSLLFGRKGGWL